MTTPMPHAGEPVAEAMGEAVQTSTMAVRLILAIADAARRAAEKRAGEEKELPPRDQAVSEAAGDLTGSLPADIATALMDGADWPQMAQQLMALKRAGVNVDELLPRVGEIAVQVRDAVAANAERIARDGTQEWATLLRETMPAGPVREAILASPSWPDIAATMRQLQERGVDVRQILVTAHDEGVGVDQAIARVTEASQRSTRPSADAFRSYGPLTEGLDIPPDLKLSHREKALQQLGISPSENSRYVRLVGEALPDQARDVALLVNSRQWPLLAARMAQMEDHKQPVVAHLARLKNDKTWQSGPDSRVGARLVQAVNEALRRPVGEPAGAGPRASTEAARAQSQTGAGPTESRVKKTAPAEAPVAPHRAQDPVRSAGRRR